MDKNRIQALITLLDDPNEEIFNSVEKQLLNERADIVPDLEKAWESVPDTFHQQRLENLIHTIQYKDVKERIREWLLNPQDLLMGAYLICRYQYPSLRPETLEAQIEQLRKDIWLELNDHLTALERVRVINHILFDIHGFRRNNTSYLSPRSTFISDVFESKKGNPISLALIYSVIAQRLGLPIYGVNLPKNFILAYLDDSLELSSVDSNYEMPVLFYINPVNKGSVLGRREIDFFIKQQKLEMKSSYYLPCENRDIIYRMLNNLFYAFESNGNKSKALEIQELMSLF
ncbi:transglutaminase-like domain-containing protein [Marinilabiliaceae bacterium ANBcel2]|nr:transglutaminase-like domain-containing protein [Marinilabiliaceae bacterium ANBcel2]